MSCGVKGSQGDLFLDSGRELRVENINELIGEAYRIRR
jgi:hypothetical protein